jgi:hypothetical protein
MLVSLLSISTVYHQADSTGIMSRNGSWSGMTAHVISGTAEIALYGFYWTKERLEVVTYTDTLGTLRWDSLICLLVSKYIWKYFFKERLGWFRNFCYFYKRISWHEKKIDASKIFKLSFCLSLLDNSNENIKAVYLISNK